MLSPAPAPPPAFGAARRCVLAAVVALVAALVLAALALSPGAPRGELPALAARRGGAPPWAAAPEPPAAVEPAAAAAAARCALARGAWCADFHAAEPEPATAPPRGARPCPGACSGVGVCDAAAGACRCPAGWGGDACADRDARPCSQFYRRDGASSPYDQPIDWASTEYSLTLRCGGACDDDIAMCFCPADTKYGRVPAEEGAPPGAPPRRRGRPLGPHCQPSRPPGGGPVSAFGDVRRKALFGAEGWCNADADPAHACPCYLEGFHGPTCDDVGETTCVNQCSGRGRCALGFCRCDAGWFGHDCAHRLAGVPAGRAPGAVPLAPWARENAVAPPPATLDPAERAAAAAAAANSDNDDNSDDDDNTHADPAPALTRRRPLVYIYELPPRYTSHMLQYRLEAWACLHRYYDAGNETALPEWGYGSEPALHEALAQSEHRTLNPEEADFFYVPVYLACFMWPVYGAADAPWPRGGPAANRAQAAAALLEEAGAWVRARPWWARRGGRDHLILAPHDEGTCYVPASLRPAIILGHWGNTRANDKSYTAYEADDWTAGGSHPIWAPEGLGAAIGPLGAFPCHDPAKDIVLPAAYSAFKYAASPFFGAPERERDIRAFFRGDLRLYDKDLGTAARYSRGIRQRLAALSAADDFAWWRQHRIWVGADAPPGFRLPGREFTAAEEGAAGAAAGEAAAAEAADAEEESYGGMLARARFCFVLPGDGWSARFEDAVLHGCIPVAIQDDVQMPFESALRLEDFSLRIAEADVARVPAILAAVRPEEEARLAANVRRVWRRYLYTGVKTYAMAARQVYGENLEAAAAGPGEEPGGGAAELPPSAAAAIAAEAAAALRGAAGAAGGEKDGGRVPRRRALRQAAGAAAGARPGEPAWEEDDAVATLLQVLHGRMLAMRADDAAREARRGGA